VFNSFYLLAPANQKSFVTQHGILWILEWSVFVPRLSGECKELLARLGRPGECLGAVCSARCEGLGLTYFC